MEDFYLDKKLENEQIINTLSEVFADLTVFNYDFENDQPEKFKNGKTYLADDNDIDFLNKTGMIKILKEYDLPIFEFDKKRYL
ncbi:hypothetical protein [Chryseobacterium chendengshani]|uniref:hypothetical protein n=1 Tax=Chryseobacterium sp. LJ756 TaxID=2864113 RepID=UPI001C63C4AB|nr:hypothetical protein [Chryseobacterium sp. LJ756]MBW7674898.1 hypothetical protein [Chryseobacterium sp. LJ756]